MVVLKFLLALVLWRCILCFNSLKWIFLWDAKLNILFGQTVLQIKWRRNKNLLSKGRLPLPKIKWIFRKFPNGRVTSNSKVFIADFSCARWTFWPCFFWKKMQERGGGVWNPKRFIADFEKVSKKLQYKTVKVQWRGSTLFEKFPKIYPIW